MISLQVLVKQLLDQVDTLDTKGMTELKREFAKQHHLPHIPSNTQIIHTYYQLLGQDKIKESDAFLRLMRKRGIRSQSGIVSVQVLTKPFPCPGQCIFCPNDPVMPKSYLKSEPGAMRAYLNNFDPIKQVYNRLLSLHLNGHKTDKIEMIVLGGTRDVYPDEYKKKFVKGLYDACNTFQTFFAKVHFPNTPKDPDKTYTLFNDNPQAQQDLGITDAQREKYLIEVANIDELTYPATLEESIQINEIAPNRIIGLTIETRPEYITDTNCRLWRTLGVTRLEIGLQSTDDDVLQANKRGHTYSQMQKGIHKLRQYGFKFSVHIMPGLYGSTIQKDIQTFHDIYADPFLKPDEIKFYPTSVLPNTALYNLYQKGEYQPLTTDQIKHIVSKVLWEIIPPYTRIKRLIRDIPATEIASGSNVTNLYQLLQREWKEAVRKGEKKPEELYRRLTLPPTPLLQGEGRHDNKISTTVLGGEIDVVSPRNFLSLDTRNREVRNRRDTGAKELKEIQGLKAKNGRAEGDTGANSHELKRRIRSEEGDVGTHFYASKKRRDASIMRPTGCEKELLVLREYRSSVGREYFISVEDELGYLYGFVRLLLPDEKYTLDREGLGAKTAIVRELHVYGTVQTLSTNPPKGIQHTGIGKRLMQKAEDISTQSGYDRLSVIAGVGVRKYYQKLGYMLEGTYMVKHLPGLSRAEQ